jgi:hypothetical protein
MIIYGYRTTGGKAEPLPHEKCPSCGEDGQMTMNIFTSYAHIFWIPLFPYRKFGVAHCSNCNATFEKKQMSDGLKRELTNVKSIVRNPIWTFTGTMLIAVLVVYGSMASSKATEEDKAFIENPAVNDVYSLKVDEGYTLMKVIAVKDSLIGIVTMDFVATKRSGLSKLKREKEYTDSLVLSKSYLKGMYDEGKIIDIER